jgi:hypothetical protein
MQFTRYFKYRAEKMSLDPEGNLFIIESQATVDKACEYILGLPICVSQSVRPEKVRHLSLSPSALFEAQFVFECSIQRRLFCRKRVFLYYLIYMRKILSRYLKYYWRNIT